nr:unnamed protein product [Callosobruchus analis]
MLEIPPWIINPIKQLLEFSTNEELDVKLKTGYQMLWLQAEIPEKYPQLWRIASKFLVALTSSYFLNVSFTVVKKRSRLNILTKMKPDGNILLSSHQVHPFHYFVIAIVEVTLRYLYVYF